MAIKQPYLKNHTLHIFSQSMSNEREYIEKGNHLPVLHSLNLELQKKNVLIDYDSIKEYYGDDDVSVFKNKSGIDCSFDILNAKTIKPVKKDFTLDWKIRFFHTSAIYDDFLAEIVSQDFGHYSNKIPVPGWAVCAHKVNDAILYIIPALNKAALVMRNELNEGFMKRRFPDNNRKIAKNGKYNTISIPITWERLTKVCPSTIIFNYE
tara:strand:- start:1338 stop:1961 length:624 start_codon:yes stop_codon:yes gene_type:complete